MKHIRATLMTLLLVAISQLFMPAFSARAGDTPLEKEFKRRRLSPLRNPVGRFPLGTVVSRDARTFVWEVDDVLEADLRETIGFVDNPILFDRVKGISEMQFNVKALLLRIATLGILQGRVTRESRFSFEPGEAMAFSFQKGAEQLEPLCQPGGALRERQEKYCTILLDHRKGYHWVIGYLMLKSAKYRFFDRRGVELGVGREGTRCGQGSDEDGNNQDEGSLEVGFRVCWENDHTLVVNTPFIYALQLLKFHRRGGFREEVKTLILFPAFH